MRDRPIRIFVSYAHEDEAWREALFSQSLYTPAGMNFAWTDDRLEPGAGWDETIGDKLRQATVAVLLVSRHFLSSVYIQRKELPELLKKRVSEGLKLLWIPIGNIESLPQGELANIQAAYSLRRPLSARPSSTPGTASRVADDVRYSIEAAIDPIGVPLMRELSQRYEPFTMIDRSHLSVVYRSYDRDLERPVVIKAPIDDGKVDEFVRSARAATRMADLPNFVKLYDAFFAQRQPYCLMQYIDGQNLRSWIEADNRRPLAIVIRILSKVVHALVAVHALGDGYGNLRPSNIMLSKTNEPFILPMGRRVAECRGRRVLDELESRSPDNEEIAYLTPEQFDEELETSAELFDQYMLGLLAFELITGEMPTAIGDVPPSPASLALIRTKGSRAFGTLPLASELRSDCSEELAQIICRMTSRRPEARYASLVELLAEVRRQEDVALTRVRESYDRCLAEQAATGRSFCEAVYKIFFERRPEAQALFQNMGPRQFEVLENAILSLFAFYEQERVRQPNEPNVLTKTAQKHDRHHLNIGLHFYSPFVESIIDTACGATGAEAVVFDPRCRGGDESARERTRSAWIEVLRPGVYYMMRRYWPADQRGEYAGDGALP